MGAGFAWLALLFLLLYDCGRGVLHGRAVATLESRLYQNEAPARVLAIPGPANPFAWRGVVETSDSYTVADVDLNEEFDPTHARVFHKPAPDEAMAAARHTPAFQEFLRFCQFPLWRISPAADVENGKVVEIVDLRFGTPLAPGFIVSTTLDAALRPIQSSFQFGLSRSK